MAKGRRPAKDAFAASFEVSLKFDGEIVGRIELFPNIFRRRVLETRLPERQDDELAGPTDEEVKNADLLAMAVVLDVRNKLLHGAGDALIDALSADLFARAGQLKTPAGRRYLSPLGLNALAVPAVKEWVGAQLAKRNADDVRDFLQLLTPGKPGRKPQVDREARKLVGVLTMTALAPHVRELRRCNDPRRYYLTWRDTDIGRRISRAGLDKEWFPVKGFRLAALKRITAKVMAVELMVAEGYGGKKAISNDLGSRAGVNLDLLNVEVEKRTGEIIVTVDDPRRTAT